MIIRSKLRPKELNIFNELFGGRLREIAPKLPKEEIKELKESARYAQKVYLVAHDTEDRQADAEAFWERIERVFWLEMNETQREIVEENQVFVRMFEALFGNSFYFENAERSIAKEHTIDVILEAFSDETFIKAVVEDVENEEKYLPKISLYELFGDPELELSSEFNFSGIHLPENILKKVDELSGEYKEKVIRMITYNIFIILDLLNKGVATASFPWCVWCDGTIKHVLFEKILAKLPEQRVSIWKQWVLKTFDFMEDSKVFTANQIAEMKKEISNIDVPEPRDDVLKEIYYTNIAQALIVQDEELIAVYFTSTKEERNIIINETVVMAKKIEAILHEVVKDFDIDYVFENPGDNEEIMNFVTWCFQRFLFTKSFMLREMEAKGANKKDWKFLENIFVIKNITIGGQRTNTSLQKSIRFQTEVFEKANRKWEEAEVRALNEKVEGFVSNVDDTDLRFSKYSLGLNMLSVGIDDICEKKMNADIQLEILKIAQDEERKRLKREALQYSVADLCKKDANLDNALNLLKAFATQIITADEYVISQRKLRTPEKYIRMFAFFYDADFLKNVN